MIVWNSKEPSAALVSSFPYWYTSSNRAILILEVASTFMFPLNDGKFGVLASNLLVNVGRLSGTVQHQGPLHQYSLLGLIRVEDNEELPGAARVLCPDVGCHEWPFSEAIGGVIILWTLAQNHWSISKKKRVRHFVTVSITSLQYFSPICLLWLQMFQRTSQYFHSTIWKYQIHFTFKTEYYAEG